MELKYAVAKAKALRPNNSVDDQYLIDAVNEVEKEVGEHMARHEQFHTAGIWWPIPQYTTDDLDDAKFIERLKTTHVSHADGDNGAKAEAHSVEAPFEGTKVTIDDLEDALQIQCAVDCGADHLVTRDAGGFGKSPVKAIAPHSLIHELGL